jgi:predicted P-loop ATPase
MAGEIKMKDQVLSEAKRLHSLGFGILLLHKKSKRPKENKWTTGPRHPWEKIKSEYHPGDNVGVRLGEASRIGENYLACIDIDVKDPEAKSIAEAKLKELIGSKRFPEVRSGAGNGSRHLYCVTAKPFKMITVAKEPGWEICIYSTGRQMVLSPSIHPTGRRYEWLKPVLKAEDLPLMDFSNLEVIKKSKELKEKDSDLTPSAVIEDFEAVDVDVSWLPIAPKYKDMIKTGEGVEDRSASLLAVAHAMYRAGLSENDILSVLTDKENYLGTAGYDHAKTNNRKRAAAWVYKYTLKKVIDNNSFEKMFGEAPEVKELSEAEQWEQEESFDDLHHWTKDLDVTKDDKFKATLRNVVIILRNAAPEAFIKRDLFAYRDFYDCDTPWEGKKGEAIIDADVSKIKLWLSNNYGIEPNSNILGESLTILALENSFDPLVDWLDALPEWDEVPRLDTWLRNHFQAVGHEDYLAQVFRKWLLGMVLRAYEPGAKFDWMPIFEGRQGVGKSSFGRLLCGDKFFLDWLPDLSNKDSALALQGNWAVEMGELASFRKNEIETVKAFITRKIDKVRPPYGERWLEVPRRCVFFGTTNYETYLRDDSGNRRFKPVKVGQLDFHQLEKDRDQLFAEAIAIYKYGLEDLKHLDIVGEAKEYERRIQSDKMVQDESALMAEILIDFFKKERAKEVDERALNFSKFLLSELFGAGVGAAPLKNWKFDARNAQFAAKALKSMGFLKAKIMGDRIWKTPVEWRKP